jgi:hypothetical protein
MTHAQSVKIPELGTQYLRELVGDEVPLEVASDFGRIPGAREPNSSFLPNFMTENFLSSYQMVVGSLIL